MKKLFVSQNLVEVESLKELLENNGIVCMIKNQRASSLAGEVPFAEVFPELWVINDEDIDRARDLMEEQVTVKDANGAVWRCLGCGERHIGTFSACWKCGREREVGSEVSQGAVQPESTEGQEPLFSDFVKGLMLGVVVVLLVSTIRHYQSIRSYTDDRNGDGKADVISIYDNNKLVGEKYDNDFDGYFETQYTYNRNGYLLKGTSDRLRKGKPDIITYYTLGRIDMVEFYDLATGRLIKLATYKLDVKTKEEIDQDGDGVFEQVIHFDKYESPLP
ncbi:MAG: DUF2007 domain-containing protein [Nitrospira sp.]|nr:DUF2007 domain-containing protein [Nitrospira sp.]